MRLAFRKPSVLLSDVTFCGTEGAHRGDIKIRANKIVSMSRNLDGSKGTLRAEAADAVALPGLVNSHDHLDFSLFPNLGHGPYANYIEWGDDIWQRDKSEIEAVLRVPMRDRLLWGGYRNLFAGVTTVVHHNPYFAAFDRDYPVRVVKDYDWAHSLDLEKERSHIRAGRRPFIIHLAEGTDALARDELDRLHALGALTSKTIIVHGIAIQKESLDNVPKGAGLVWCPSSNQFLFGQTADIKTLATRFRIALGSDSPLTSKGNFLDEIRSARATGIATDRELIAMITQTPASLFGLQGLGNLEEGGIADVLLLDRQGTDPWESLWPATQRNIQLVLKAGKPMYGDERFEPLFEALGRPYDRVNCEGRVKLVGGKFAKLVERIERVLPEARRKISP